MGNSTQAEVKESFIWLPIIPKIEVKNLQIIFCWANLEGLKKAIAETSVGNGGLLCDYLLKWHHEVKVLPCDYPNNIYVCVCVCVYIYIYIYYIYIIYIIYIYIYIYYLLPLILGVLPGTGWLVDWLFDSVWFLQLLVTSMINIYFSGAQPENMRGCSGNPLLCVPLPPILQCVGKIFYRKNNVKVSHMR